MEEPTQNDKPTSDKPKPEDPSKSAAAVWSQIAATGLIGLAGILFTIVNSRNETRRQASDTATQLLANREKSETDFRQQIFQPLIDKVLNDDLSIEKRYAVFEIFQNNFNDLFNSRSLYDVLWNTAQSNIRNNKDSAGAKVIQGKLIALARYTNAQQEGLIAQSVFDTTVSYGSNVVCRFDSLSGHEMVSLKILTMDTGDLKKDIGVTMTINCLEEKTPCLIRINNGAPFRISYFNSPLSSNFLMPDGDRIAVILENIKKGNGSTTDSAFIRIVHFPADFVTVGYRPSITRVNQLIDGKKE